MPRNKISRKPRRKNRARRRGVTRVAVVANPGLQKIVNYHSSSVKVLIIDNIGISSNTGSPNITFSGGVNYYDWKTLFTLTDFTDNANYRFAKIHSVTLNLERSVDEITMATMMTGNFIYINAYPELFSTSIPISGISRDQYAYKVDTMTFDHQSYKVPMVNIQLYDTQINPVIINPSKAMPYSEVQYLPGQFSIGSDKTLNAPATQKLFNIKVSYLVTFFGRT
jgi:hypothetical protein